MRIRMRKAERSPSIMATPGRPDRPGQTESDEEGRFQTMTTYEPAPVSRWLKAIGLLVLATAVLAVAGCGGDSETPAVCDSLETLSSDVDGLKDISLEDGENAEDVVAEVEQSLDTIRGDLDTVKTDAESGALRADRRSRELARRPVDRGRLREDRRPSPLRLCRPSAPR